MCSLGGLILVKTSRVIGYIKIVIHCELLARSSSMSFTLLIELYFVPFAHCELNET